LIAGLGSIGRQHLRNLVSLGERDIILYRTHKSTLPDDELEDFPVVTDLESGLSQEPDAVIVANPTSMHLDTALPAARAGCHLLLEKPVSHSMDGIEEFSTAVEISKVGVLIGYQYRFHPGLQKVKDLLQNNAIGEVVSARAHWGEFLPGWHPWEDHRLGYSGRSDLGGGVVLTLSHPIDYLCWLLSEVDEIWAFSGNLGELGVDVEDTAEIGMRFSIGTIGSIHLNYVQQPPEHYLQLVGTRGTIKWDYSDGGVSLYRSEEEKWQFFPIRDGFVRNDMLIAEMAHFINLVKGLEQPKCSLSDGVLAMNLAIAAKKSSAGKKKLRISAETGKILA
jgi:predicted dehydrogenase